MSTNIYICIYSYPNNQKLTLGINVAYLFFDFELLIRKAVYLTNQASIHFDWKNVSVRYIIFHVFVNKDNLLKFWFGSLKLGILGQYVEFLLKKLSFDI